MATYSGAMPVACTVKSFSFRNATRQKVREGVSSPAIAGKRRYRRRPRQFLLLIRQSLQKGN
jgi:hypothetical protein